MIKIIKQIFSPYPKPEGKRNVHEIIESASIENRTLSESDWRQMILSTYIRIEEHEKICMIRGGVMISGLIVLILLQLDIAWGDVVSRSLSKLLTQ